jgi:ribosomal protein S18 acetylase RimI-like enzyme
MVSLQVRRLTDADDLGAMGRIVVASYQALPGHPDVPEYDAELADVAGRVRAGVVFGAFDGDVPVGCVTYVNDLSSPHAEGLGDGEASFRMLAVSTRYQGRGIGGALVTSCLDEARTNGRDAVFIHSGAWMTTAHRLYERLGFVRIVDRDWVLSDVSVTLLGFRHPL